MKTKQVKEEQDKSLDEETVVEPKTRARKKASDVNDDDKTKTGQDEAKTSKEIKKTVTKPRAVVKKKPLGIRKTLRSKKAAVAAAKEKVKKVIKGTRGRKPAVKTEPITQDKEAISLIPASEIKKEPIEETTPNSRSSSPKTAGRRPRVGSDMAMMKTMLGDSPTLLGPRTSPYSMRSERSNSPSLFEGKNLRSGKPRKVKSNLLNEVVMKEQKKRRRLLSDSKNPDGTDVSEDCKKIKRGRSCSRDGSEISKCSDNTESDISLSEPLNDTDSREPNKKLDKSKTDHLDVDIENIIQISNVDKVPSLNFDSDRTEVKPDAESSCKSNERNKNLSLKRSTSLDSDNNNSNRLKLDNLNSPDIEDDSLKTEMPFEDRSSILTSMSKTFNSKEVARNMKKVRRGKKWREESRRPSVAKNCLPEALAADPADPADDKHETLETLSKEIDDLINDLDQSIDGDHGADPAPPDSDQSQTKSVSKFYGLSKPLSSVDDNALVAPDTPVKDRDALTPVTNDNTPSKLDESENIRLHYEEDSVDKTADSKVAVTYKVNTVASIDKLMDRLKEFEEFDKKRQRQESECKPGDGKPMMVTNDVVLIPKSGAEIKPLKDSITQSIRSPERPIEKENVLSCFENNAAISIVKRDHSRKSIEDISLGNSVTLIKRNSVTARKESTSSNHSRENDAISIFEKSLGIGKDVTLTEIRKSVDKGASTPNLNTNQNVAGVMIDSSQISITPRVLDAKNSNNVQIISKRKSRESLSRKSSESVTDSEERLAAIGKMKSPTHPNLSPAISITPSPVAIKSPEAVPMDTEALPPPLDNIQPEEILASEVPKNEKEIETAKADIPEVSAVAPTQVEEKKVPIAEQVEAQTVIPDMETSVDKEEKPETEDTVDAIKTEETAKVEVEEPPEPAKAQEEPVKEETKAEEKSKLEEKTKVEDKNKVEEKPKSPVRPSKSTRSSTESQAGPSNAFNETPESQKRKENVLRTLGLLTHKAAKAAKIEKLKEKERIYSNMKSKGAKTSQDYTGTLKTVIKLNRGGDGKKKHRSSLKMTFQKSKYRAGKPASDENAPAEDDAYYTIERREGGGTSADDTEAAPEPAEPKETLNLVIPEKASSFSIHPGRLCQDQCFYCGGKFGLFDTPCHIAQIKSSERQKKVLDNEEKLTIDSCLCDACYRHVDRRANCPSYRKRPYKDPLPPSYCNSSLAEKPPSPDEESEEEAPAAPAARSATCHTQGCVAPAAHSIRRKWLIKMRFSVSRLLTLKSDYPGLHTIPLCAEHHRRLAGLMACALCRRRLTKHHNLHFIHQGFPEINSALLAARVPVALAARAVVCKACRCYCSLLQRDARHHSADQFARAHTRKLLQVYNIEAPPSPSPADEADADKRRKPRAKTKRRSTEPGGETPSELSPEKESSAPMEEDIESLISLNKIPVPGAMAGETPPGDPDGDPLDKTPRLVDKQTELQYLLQKQNNPDQFLHQPNLTLKQKNLLKLQTAGVQKPSNQQRIADKNAKRIHKLGQIVVHKDKARKEDGADLSDKSEDGLTGLKNLSLNEECTIESIPVRRPADIASLKNKWQMSESSIQVKKNLSQLSKKLTVEKDPKKSEAKYSNPVKRLETNPSISVRELFPGEEEMNLQCNIEFNNVKGVTPEGWEKCNTMIQYDVETKKLWNELQRPYGNQSSFLRHLILLEKYFRRGDLVLAQTATPTATCYSDSVQSRLKAYDNVPPEPRRSEVAVSLIEFRKKPSVNGKSLLKSNQEPEKEQKKAMPPPGPRIKPKEKQKSKPLPPELIAINTPNAQGRKAIQNVLHNIQQLVKGVSAADPTEVAAAPLPPPMPPPVTPPVVPAAPPAVVEPPKEKDPPKPEPTPKKKKPKPTSKPWRPTLMPITPENLSRIGREPTAVAVDGRELPPLVQVMSAGQRYHITLQDYNKMCVMRREKLQQVHDAERRKDETVVTEIQPSATLGNGGTLTQTVLEDRSDLIGSNAATILKNVGLKNITIAPIPPKTATVTSVTSPSPVTAGIKIPPLLGSSSEMVMPKIPRSLTVIPQLASPPPERS